MDALSEKLKEVVGRVGIVSGESGDVSIDVPGYREGSRLYTSAERVAWELTRAFLSRAPGRGAWMIDEELYAWRARVQDELAIALKKGELSEFDLDRYLEETKYVR
jgi:hypothetical protein